MHEMIRTALLGLLSLFAIVSISTFGFSNNGTITNMNYSEYVGSTQTLFSETSMGTSWLIDLGPNKFITAWHVISDYPIKQYYINGPESDRSYKINVIYKNPKYDLVLFEIENLEEYEDFMRVNGNPKSLKISDLGVVREGDQFWSIGNPLYQFFSYWTGHVAKTNFFTMSPRELGDDSVYTILDGLVGPGASGGPVFDKNGNVIGVVQSSYENPGSSTYGHIVSNNTIWKFVEEWKNDISVSCNLTFGIAIENFLNTKTEWATIDFVTDDGVLTQILESGDTRIRVENRWSKEMSRNDPKYENGITWKRYEDLILTQKTLFCNETAKITFERNGEERVFFLDIPN